MWALHNNEVWGAHRILRSVVNTRFVSCISSRYVLCTLNIRRRKRKKPSAYWLFHERKEWQHCRDDSREVQTLCAWHKQLGLHSLTRPFKLPWYKRYTEGMCSERISPESECGRTAAGFRLPLARGFPAQERKYRGRASRE
jgi:hypothetical protein